MATREEDIETVCHAIIDNQEEYNPNGKDYCRFCISDKYNKDGSFDHHVYCPVLVAKDLLTRAASNNKFEPTRE